MLTASADQTARVWEVFSPAVASTSREATIKETQLFDFESGHSLAMLPDDNSPIDPRADVRWEAFSRAATQSLVPLNKTRLTYIGSLSPADFEKLSLAELQGLDYSDTPIIGNDSGRYSKQSNQLLKGNVFAVATEGDEFIDYAKVQVVEYGGGDLKIRWVTYHKQKEGFGRLSLTTNPGGYPILIDGRPAGETSTTARIFDLPVGLHTIEVLFPNSARWTREIDVARGRQYCAALNYDPKEMKIAVTIAACSQAY